MHSNTAWIIGASSGLGRALALHLARDGWRVVASARNADALQTLAERGRRTSGEIHPLVLDVTDVPSLEAARERTAALVGNIGHCFVSAAFYEPQQDGVFDAALHRRHMSVNYLGVIDTLAVLLDEPALVPPNIYITASVAGYRGLPGAGPYGASKAALINLCESLRVDLAGRGVTLRLICPGFIDTPLTAKNRFPMPFMISAEAAARRIAGAIGRGGFEIDFPRRFTWQLKLLRLLPYRLFFPVVRAVTGT